MACDHDRACGKGFSCDRHFGLCVPLRQEGKYCRRDAQCVRGLSCMYGRCIRSIPEGQEGKGNNVLYEVSLKAQQCQCMMKRNSACVSLLKCELSINLIIIITISGARCKVDKDCGTSMCCARHHGERVCKRRLVLGESCFVPDGGLAFSINQICPCDEGLLCRGNGQPQKREYVFSPCINKIVPVYFLLPL